MLIPEPFNKILLNPNIEERVMAMNDDDADDIKQLTLRYNQKDTLKNIDFTFTNLRLVGKLPYTN
jgi:hypothetical protein